MATLFSYILYNQFNKHKYELQEMRLFNPFCLSCIQWQPHSRLLLFLTMVTRFFPVSNYTLVVRLSSLFFSSRKGLWHFSKTIKITSLLFTKPHIRLIMTIVPEQKQVPLMRHIFVSLLIINYRQPRYLLTLNLPMSSSLWKLLSIK